MNTLSPYRPRQFVPAAIDFSDWKQIAPLFDRLQTAPVSEQWLQDWSELSAALDEESSRRYIAMTCHTEDADAERAYLHFLEKIEPELKPRQFTLNKLYAEHPITAPRYEVFNRDIAVAVELFRPENVPLETEEAKLGQQYQKLTGSLTVQFRGEERTLVQMGRHLEETDRALRQEAWELVARRRLQERERFEEQFDSLLKLREQIAGNAGYRSYLEYSFRRLRRFDYTPADCVKFHDAVEQEVLPVLRELQAARRRHLSLPALRPWDLAVDPAGQPPLRPNALTDGAQQIFDRLGFGDDFRLMRDQGLLDLDNRKGKAPGGYQCNLNECRLPFIFMNAVGQQRDVETLLHEGGHAFHALATKDEELFAYRNNVPVEFSEVASMSMELLGNEHLDAFYDAAGVQRARRAHLEGIVALLPWVATVDAFQHWIYTHPGHLREERAQVWLGLMKRFGGDVDWSGYETERSFLWHRQLHVFLSPLYYIEYGIAQLGALQVWANSRQDHPRALQAYRRALAIGGARPLPELFRTAECRFEFGGETLRPLMKMVRDELGRTEMF
jgi:oligoendopeptidase F